jgi:hypothetical protein
MAVADAPIDRAPFAFTGTIKKVTFKVEARLATPRPKLGPSGRYCCTCCCTRIKKGRQRVANGL